MNQLKSIRIDNYKCYKRVSFNIKDINVMIGENNAGKSTAVEAIKLLAFGINTLKKGCFISSPLTIDPYVEDMCVKLNITDLLIDISTAGYKYDDSPSEITGYFENKIKVVIVINKKDVYAFAYIDNQCVINRSSIKNIGLPSIFVMPHFNLLKDNEKYINEKRTQRDLFNYRSSLHFRNELYNYQDSINELNDYLKNTWPKIQVEIEYKPGVSTFISAMVRNDDFTAEIKNYGSGLQMWMQILWFLCKIKETDCVVILDEPDVYIHADLQRKLYRLVVDTYTQVIIATHSIEIINEANISNIMIVDKQRASFKFCKERASLAQAMRSIGTSQNLMLTKLQRYNKCLFVEGNDIEILDRMFQVVNKDNSISLKDFATSPLGGKDHYREMFGAASLFREDSDNTFKIFCILDRDYNDEYNAQIKEDAEKYNITLCVLDRLEIENYLIVPRIIAEIANKEIEEINEKIVELADTLKDVAFDRILEANYLEYKKINPKQNISIISSETRSIINSSWDSLDSILKIIPGKELKAKIYEWLKSDFGISCNDKKILEKIQICDIPTDLKNILKELNA